MSWGALITAALMPSATSRIYRRATVTDLLRFDAAFSAAMETGSLKSLSAKRLPSPLWGCIDASKDESKAELHDARRISARDFAIPDVLIAIAGLTGESRPAAEEVDRTPLRMIKGIKRLKA